MQTLALGLAHRIQGMAGPALERQGFLIRIDEMEKANLAAGEAFHNVQRGSQNVVQTAAAVSYTHLDVYKRQV